MLRFVFVVVDDDDDDAGGDSAGTSAACSDCVVVCNVLRPQVRLPLAEASTKLAKPTTSSSQGGLRAASFGDVSFRV